ncbi:hypothetical protein CVS40_9067 [Lucilia cuprina]|nr:hypothetical protein CVS40_9067 [Lucilia cuprina]
MSSSSASALSLSDNLAVEDDENYHSQSNQTHPSHNHLLLPQNHQLCKQEYDTNSLLNDTACDTRNDTEISNDNDLYCC